MHELQTFFLAVLECLLQLPVVCLLRRHASLTRRNFNVFFLQRVSYRDVEGRRPEAVVVLLYRDVAGLLLRLGELMLLLDHDRREPSSLGCVTKDVPQVVVPKQTRRSKMAAERVVAIDVQLFAADSTSLAARG